MVDKEITFDQLVDMINLLEEMKTTIPEGKALITGSEELVETMKIQGWKGEYFYTPYLEKTNVYLVNKEKFKFVLMN